MRVNSVAFNTELRNIHPAYFEHIPKQPRRRPTERPFVFPELPKSSPLDDLRSKVLEISVERLEVLQRICAFALIAIGVFMIGQLIFEFYDKPAPPRPVRVIAPKIVHPAPTLQSDEIEKKFEAIANVLEYLVNQQRQGASRPLPLTPSVLVSPPSPAQPEPQDLQVVEVTVSKANLRVGPGLENSPLMTVAQGTRLVVEIEESGWYRVVAPNGERVWVSSKVVAPR